MVATFLRLYDTTGIALNAHRILVHPFLTTALRGRDHLPTFEDRKTRD